MLGLAIAAACSPPPVDVRGDATPQERAAACTPVRAKRILEHGTHIAAPERGTYNSVPPTSGRHYPQTVPAGVYAEPIPDERQVHNLEHGHVLIQHRNLTEAEVALLSQVALEDARMIVVAPYPDMVPKLALTAWGRIQTCDAVNASVVGVVRAFVRAYRDRAPESIP